MRSKIFVVSACILALIVLNAFPCLAQADIDQDHYEAANLEAISQAQQSVTENPNLGGLRGDFTLPFNVRCAGITLLPGSYSLSISSLDKWSVVTLIPKGNAANGESIKIRVNPRPSVGGRDALVLSRTGQQRALTAITLKEPGRTLYLQDEQRRIVSTNAEFVPIIYAISTIAGD